MKEHRTGRDSPDEAIPFATAAVDILEELPVGALVVDRTGNVVADNAALRALWGQQIGKGAGVAIPVDAYGPDGRRIDPKEWPIWRSLRTGAEVVDEDVEIESAEGDPVTVRVSSRPIHDDSAGRVGAVMIVHDVSLERDRTELREAFIGVLSHELRTPITAIYSGVDLLRSDGLDDELREGVLDDIAVEAESLDRMVEDLLAIARLERGVSHPAVEPVLVQRIIALALADERRRWPTQTFTESFPSDLPPVRADEGLVRQVLRNLISNAAKYGSAEGTVEIGASVDAEEVHVRVIDDGPGIPERLRERVFDLHYRGTASQSLPGAGIGLYVARALSEAMGGGLRLGDRPGGAEFIVDLPRYPISETP